MAADDDRPPQVKALRDALHQGDLRQVRHLVDAGADLHYRAEGNYNALVDAVHGRRVTDDPGLLALLDLLIERGVDLDAVTSYGESGLSVLSRLGRFDGVRRLLDAGANPEPLGWTPLIRAVALRALEDVRSQLDTALDLEARDGWSRTAWLVALMLESPDVAQLLRDRGVDISVVGRCGKPPMFHAIECHRTAVLGWLLAEGFDPGQTDDFGDTALMHAAEVGHAAGVELLLTAGVDLDSENNGDTALSKTVERPLILRLLDAGADPRFLKQEGVRTLLQLPPEWDEELLNPVTREQFLQGRSRRFGKTNPERIHEPFWQAMIRSGVCGFTATQRFRGPSPFKAGPVWCAQRFGQSVTRLPDGRIVLIGGEHEDWYDPDFCIYNDVFVWSPDGTVEIFGYPREVFPPTDFHTATLVGNAIYIVGCLGYREERRDGETPVFRLRLQDWRIECLRPRGPGPGWVHNHQARLLPGEVIAISGGEVAVQEQGEEKLLPNTQLHLLDLNSGMWRAFADTQE